MTTEPTTATPKRDYSVIIHLDGNWYPDLADLQRVVRSAVSADLNHETTPVIDVIDGDLTEDVAKLAERVGELSGAIVGTDDEAPEEASVHAPEETPAHGPKDPDDWAYVNLELSAKGDNLVEVHTSLNEKLAKALPEGVFVFGDNLHWAHGEPTIEVAELTDEEHSLEGVMHVRIYLRIDVPQPAKKEKVP